MMQGQITEPKAALSFILAGKATVTLRSLASGNRYTYKIVEAEKRNPNDAQTWFVKLLNGPDNTNSFVYIGIIRGNQFVWTSKSRVGKDAPSIIGFTFVLNALVSNKINGFEVWHEGKCGRCGRKLTVPESVSTGFGPDCAEMVGATAPIAAPVVVVQGIQRNINFDGSARVAKPAVAVAGVAAPVAPKTFSNVGEIDTEIRRRIALLQEDQETYTQDGELDSKEAFNVAYNKFRVEIQRENS